MDLVRFGKTWEINTIEDYEKAVKALNDADFCAMMADDYNTVRREQAEVARQMGEVVRMAKARGII